MSSFRPGPVPPGVVVQRPHWPTFTVQRAASPPQSSEPAPPVPTVQTAVRVEETVNEARLEAAQILQNAAAEAEAATEAARKEGYASGHAEGLAAGQAEVESLRSQAQAEVEQAQAQSEAIRQTAEAQARATRAEAEKEAQAIRTQAEADARQMRDQANAELLRRLDEAQPALVELAVAAAMRLVQGQLAIQPAAVVTMVAAGLRRLKDTNCTVRVSPEDLPLMEAQRSTLERELGAGLLQVQPDPTLTQGSYLVTSPQGQIDGTLEQQAERLQAALNAALGGNRP